MNTINLKIPVESVNQGEKAVLIEVGIQLYKQKIFTFGQVRRLLNVSVWELQKILGEHKIERHYEEADLAEDLASIERGDWEAFLFF
ncbi:MAG: UPF0175 family protein [Oscillatoria sp. SIO1A7]|nr:UPF0175 family protein [Oscillatoria sp. SIO1A7]